MAEKPDLRLADACFRRHAHLPDDRAQRIGHVGVLGEMAVIADQGRKNGIVERRRSCCSHAQPLYRDQAERNPGVPG